MNADLLCFKDLFNRLESPITCINSAKGKAFLTKEVADKLRMAEGYEIFNGTVQYDENNYSLESNESRLIGKHVQIEIEYLSGRIYRNFEGFLQTNTHLVSPPEQFLLLDSSIDIQAESGTKNLDIVRSYFELTKVLNAISIAKDHSDIAHQWYFLHKGKLEFTVEYTADHIKYLNLDGHKIFLEIMKDDEHRQQKKYIIQETLIKLIGGEKTEIRFSKLLTMLPEFFVLFEQNYRLFVANFSFDDLRKEYEERYREYITKMNESLSDATTKSLAVPASLLFAITRLSFDQSGPLNKLTESAIRSAMYQQIAMLVVITIVSVLIWLLASSHKKSLSAIKIEFESLMGRLSAQTQSQETTTRNKIATILDDLNSRRKSVNDILTFIQVISMSSPVMSFIYIFCR